MGRGYEALGAPWAPARSSGPSPGWGVSPRRRSGGHFACEVWPQSSALEARPASPSQVAGRRGKRSVAYQPPAVTSRGELRAPAALPSLPLATALVPG